MKIKEDFIYIDGHTHLDSFKENIDKVIEDINKNKILTLANSMDIDSYPLNKEYGKRMSMIALVFIHGVLGVFWRADSIHRRK